jgi:acylpyruvate hydrolase
MLGSQSEDHMRFVTFETNNGLRLGALDAEEIVEISASGSGAPKTMRELAGADPETLERISSHVSSGKGPRHALSECRLRNPMPSFGKFICLGLNYAAHAREGGNEVPSYPSMFMRVSTSLIGPGDSMIVPACSPHLDYEAELVIVIGKKCRNVREKDALDTIFGYTIFNDGSVRDYQKRTAQWTAGKNFDGTGAVGPWIVTADELPPGAAGLGIRSILNGRVMQDSNTSNMLVSVARTIEIISEIMTLEPGDLIATGTPEGVGHARKPPVWMKAGDEITIEIEGIGTLTNPVAEEVAKPETVHA